MMCELLTPTTALVSDLVIYFPGTIFYAQLITLGSK